MEPFLQIAPHSLAIVLSRTGAGEVAGVSESDELPRHHTGYEIFANFKAENSQLHVWNQRVSEAVSETFFLGWIDEHVLLIQGKEDHLEALREGWMRRCLNPPRGFTIKYLGDVSPISMSPISQPQFIPLGEVLLLAISALNSAHKPVTEEALTEHLQTCFQGVPTPTEEALHHTLSMLVHERKIYPTPNGYFIVTPQTYFITPSLVRTGSKWYHLDEHPADRHQYQKPELHQLTQCTSPLSGTITPSTSGGLRDRTYKAEGSQSHHATLQRCSPKDHREVHSSPQTPSQQVGGNLEKGRGSLGFAFKMDTLTKHKGGAAVPAALADADKSAGSGSGSRKFGLKLFRLSFKKDKTKQLVTFSAQFPPEEWPLPDEDTPNQMPRFVEMEIIRRINPDLTVENLARHTAVMKRLEEERVQRSMASSANQSSRSRRSGGRHRKQSQTKHGRSHSKTRSTRFDQTDSSRADPANRDYRGHSSSLARSPREQALAVERHRARLHLAHSIPNILESTHLPVTPEWDVSGGLAKRRMEVPFPEPSHVPLAHHSKVHRSHSHTQERKSRSERSSKAKERSRSMDNSKAVLGVGPVAPSNYYDNRSRYYTEDGSLRANQNSTPFSRAPLTTGLEGGRSFDRSKSRDSLVAYKTLPPHSAPPDEYFQCSGKPTNTLGTLCRSSSDQQPPHPPESKEDPPEGGTNGGSFPSIPLPVPDSSLPNMRPPNSASCGQEKNKEVFNKDGLFDPPSSLPLSSYSSLKKTLPLSSSCDALDAHSDTPKPLVATSSAPPLVPEATSGAADASLDYYNVSDDEEAEEGGARSKEGALGEKSGGVAGTGRGGAGTMQWLLEREKTRDLQRRFERTLSLSGAKDHLPEPGQNQQASHSARLDSMDSSSVTVDSGFNSPRTRESLASNTSSVVESNRRQNLALSPGHLGMASSTGPPFSFHTISEPPSSQTEKLQKPSGCLASITSV
ncbi:storkhead-box protein 2 isoform X1 [Oryzias latipes]|uniref:Winged helix Storkhead-box1 domain-containing protein n=2 Tax=Oryzias latipes TaxID=8090 RepID=H2N281_ORYLA|nr:storkhead-box protein 2 isoform X1 [Oryzias latipes]